MSDPDAAQRISSDPVLRALRLTRQVREFTAEQVTEADLEVILEVARWTGSAKNTQAWMFVVIRDPAERGRLAELAPYARHVAGAAVAIAIAMGGTNAEWDTFDEGRASERILIAAGALGLGAGIGWVPEPRRVQVAQSLGLVPPAFVRTIISLGHPTAAALQPKLAPGAARRTLVEITRQR